MALSGHVMTLPRIIGAIGIGNFWVKPDMPPETPEEIELRTKKSLIDQTFAFADWQQLEIRRWMAGIRWVDTAEEALRHYDDHLKTLPNARRRQIRRRNNRKGAAALEIT